MGRPKTPSPPPAPPAPPPPPPAPTAAEVSQASATDMDNKGIKRRRRGRSIDYLNRVCMEYKKVLP
jgi:hypothetical protein